MPIKSQGESLLVRSIVDELQLLVRGKELLYANVPVIYENAWNAWMKVLGEGRDDLIAAARTTAANHGTHIDDQAWQDHIDGWRAEFQRALSEFKQKEQEHGRDESD